MKKVEDTVRAGGRAAHLLQTALSRGAPTLLAQLLDADSERASDLIGALENVLAELDNTITKPSLEDLDGRAADDLEREHIHAHDVYDRVEALHAVLGGPALAGLAFGLAQRDPARGLRLMQLFATLRDKYTLLLAKLADVIDRIEVQQDVQHVIALRALGMLESGSASGMWSAAATDSLREISPETIEEIEASVSALEPTKLVGGLRMAVGRYRVLLDRDARGSILVLDVVKGPKRRP